MAGRGLNVLAFLFVVVLAAAFSGSSSGGSVGPEGAFHDVILVVKYWLRNYWNSFKPRSAFCITNDNLVKPTVLGDDGAVHTDTIDTNAVTLTGLSDVWAAACSSEGKDDVIGPILYPQATLIRRRRLSINKGEDLRIRLNTGTRYGQVRWRKESLQQSAWNVTTLTDNELIIPSNSLQGSGTYSVIPITDSRHITSSTGEYGVVFVVVRECPELRFGNNCEEWCPYCLHGGVCDARSGECVCPAGVMGHRCQTVCQEGYIGRDCSLRLNNNPAGQVVCTGAQMGCTCAPGYSGEDCQRKCPGNKWGVDCKQTCQDCYSYCYDSYGRRNCPYTASCSRWGKCSGTQWRRCGEGDLGLPRLRNPPIVESTTLQSVNVFFSAWQENYDDGELPFEASPTYWLHYWPNNNTSLAKNKKVQPNTRNNLGDLELGMTYHIQVLMSVEVDGEQCLSGAARVRTYTTSCPFPQQPQGLTAETNGNSLDVWWQDVHYGRRCGFQYYLDVAPKPHRNYTKHFNTTDASIQLKGLQSNTKYIISIYTCNQNKVDCSIPATIHTTLLGEWYVKGHHENNVVVFNWGLVDGNVNNLQFQSYYEISRKGSIDKSSDWTTWSTKTNRTIAVSPFSKVTLWVKIKIDPRQKYKIVTVPPSEPGKVTELKATAWNGTDLYVNWSKPGDNPPKGELEYFRVTWGEAGQADTQSYNVTVGTWQQETFNYDIRKLKPNTQYMIKVEAKNKNVDKYGVATTTSATTTMGAPSQVKGLKCDAGEVSLTFTWQPYNNLTSITTWYTVMLSSSSHNVREQNTSTISAKFEGLSNTTKYEAKVKACNVQQCGEVQDLQCWTQPSLPTLEGTVDLEAANDTTITILLPLITNPPGWHYVMLVKEGRQPRTQGWKDTLTNTALNLIRQDNEAGRTRSVRAATQEAAGGQQMYIATKVVQEGRERIRVTVGGDASYGNHYDKHPLEKDAAYWIVVVAEKTGGGHTRHQVSTPMRFVVTNGFGPGEASALIGGLCTAAVVIAAVTTVVIVYLRKRRNGLSGKPNCTVDTPVCEPWPEHVPIPLVATTPTTTEHQDHLGKEDIYANVTLQVNDKDLEAYLLRAVSSRDTRIEFDGVPFFMSNNFTESQRPENRIKNRYKNKICYDETRVILPLYNDIPHSDYINANHVKGPNRPAAFIATQGVKGVTVGAFWRMMWHSNCRVIVMVANLKEGEKEKVAQYWPEHEPWTTEGVTVTPTGVTVKMDFVIRTFTVSVGITKREMSQYQYIAWPDHGVPNMPYGLAHMIKLIRTHYSREVPLTVHCSAGIGRTGTVILVMYWMDQLEASGAVNFSGALSVLRCGRGRLVENTEQYIFAHQVLHEVLFGLDTTISCHAFEDKLLDLRSPQPPDGVSPIHQQHKKLKSLPKDLNFRYGKDPACAHLNRNQHILPADNRMVFVQGQGYGTDNQYLNIIRINGVDRKDAYLVSEHPQSHTLAKMWRLVYERKVPVWVLIHTFPDHDPEFPDVVCESSALFNNMTLSASPTQTFQSYNERRVDINVAESSEVNKHTCFVISLRGWPATACLPASPEPLIALLEKTEALSSQTNPPLFTCKDGVTGCGVVVGLLLAVSRAKVLQEVDIYRSVASIQQDRPQFVENLDQYDFLYDAMLAFLRSNDHYGNFN